MKKYILPGALVVFCGIIIYQTYSLKAIKDELVTIKDMNVALQEELNAYSVDISSLIQETLNEELGKSHITKDVNFKFIKNQKDGYDLSVRVEMKEIKENSNILFMYKDKDLDDWQELELKKIGELSYTGNFLLPYDKNYEYKVLVKGDTTESSDVEPIYKDEFMPYPPDCSWNYDETGIYFNANPDYSTQEINNKIKKLQVIVSHNKKEKIYNCKYKDEDAYDENNEIVDEFKYYEVEIPKKDYRGKLDYIKMKITYEDGMIDIVDVTNQNVEEDVQ